MPKNLDRRSSCERSSSTNECSAHRSNEEVWLLRRRRTAGLLLETRLCAPVDRTRLCSVGRKKESARSTTFSTASVKLGKDRGEHNESGVSQKAEIVGTLSPFRVGHRNRHGSTIFSSPAVCDLADAVDEQRRHRIRLRLDNLLLHSRHQKQC